MSILETKGSFWDTLYRGSSLIPRGKRAHILFFSAVKFCWFYTFSKYRSFSSLGFFHNKRFLCVALYDDFLIVMTINPNRVDLDFGQILNFLTIIKKMKEGHLTDLHFEESLRKMLSKLFP